MVDISQIKIAYHDRKNCCKEYCGQGKYPGDGKREITFCVFVSISLDKKIDKEWDTNDNSHKQKAE